MTDVRDEVASATATEPRAEPRGDFIWYELITSDIAGEPVVLVNDKIVEKLFLGEEAIGKEVRLNGEVFRVIGVYHPIPNAFDPEANVEGGTKYLRELLERYNFDIVKALAAYNAGPQRVEKFGGILYFT